MSHERRLYNLEQLEAIDGMAFSQKHYPELGGWQNPKTLVIHGHCPQQRDVPHFAAPVPFQSQAIQIHIRVVAFDRLVAPGLDLRVDLLVQLAHRARADARAP